MIGRYGYGVRRRTGLTAAIGIVLIAMLAPPAASANFHLTKISEVYPGTLLCPDCAFVELQAYSDGQNVVSGHSVVFYDKNGAVTHTATMNANVPNAETQRTIVIADLFPPDAVSADFTSNMGTLIVPSGGAACFDALDCVAWGDITPAGLAGLPSPAGSPVSPSGITDTNSIVRSIAPGCATLLEASDDTDDSATDFSLTNDPNPRPNSVTPTEVACSVPAPDTVIDKGPKKKIKAAKAKFRFSSPDAGASFECRLDGKPYKPCASPLKLKRIKRGKHVFSVRAVLAGTSDPSPADLQVQAQAQLAAARRAGGAWAGRDRGCPRSGRGSARRGRRRRASP